MANEIKINISATLLNGFQKDQFNPGQISVDQAAEGRGGHVQTIGTSQEVVDFGDIGTSGYIMLRNLDDTNYVRYGPTSDAATIELFGKLKPGEVACFRLEPGIVMRAQANVASVKLDVKLWED